MIGTGNRWALALFGALALAAGSASATNGYYTHGLGTKSKGMAGAGSANPEETLALATNPAGIAFVARRLDLGLGLFSPLRDYSTSSSLANGNCSPQGCAFTIGPNSMDSENELFAIPYIATSWALSDVDYLAAAFYGRGGMNTRWVGGTATFDPSFGQGTGPVTFPGTYGSGTAGVDLMQGFLNLTYARKMTDSFSVGASGIFAMQRFEARGLGNFAPFTKTYVESLFTTGQPALPTKLSDNGHEMSYGYGGSLGLQWNASEKLQFAAAYTSKISMSKFNDYADLFAGGGAFDMPSTWTVGVAVKATERLALVADVQEIAYSDIAAVSNPVDNLFSCPILNPASTAFENCLGGSNGAGFGWQDMTVYKLGGEYQYSDDWTFRAGYSWTKQPIPADQMTFNILAPGVVEQHFTVGFTRKQAGGNEWNVAFMYAPTKNVSGPNNFDPTQTVEFGMHQFELEVSYSWQR